MMDLGQAIDAAKALRDASRASRGFGRAFWSLACCYAYGNQWAYLSPERAGLREARQLRAVVDPKRVDVRVHINEIRPAIRWMRSALNPNRMEAHLAPADGSPEGKVVKDAGEKLLNRHLIDTNALSVYRRANEMRLVLGTGIIRRTLKTTGSMAVNKDLNIRNIRPGWATVFPYEVIRDPAANTCDPGWHEEQYGIEKPRTLGWIKENWGVSIPEADVDAKLGDLIDYQKELQGASSGGMNQHAMDSQAKAVLFYEFYFKDAKKGPGWMWMLPCFSKAKSDPQEIIPLVDKLLPNPFQPPPETERLAALGLPFHHMNYEVELQGMWGTGIPHILMAGQDIYNLAMTWYLRMMQAGGGKIVFDQGTIEDPEKTFNNRVDMGIEYRPKGNRGSRPERLDGPKLQPAASAFIQMMPQWMDRALNRTPVQKGITSPRGESGKAVVAKLEAAGMPLEDTRREDELCLQDLLYATWLDVANPKILRLDQAKRLIGKDMPPSHIAALLREPPHTTVRTVTVKRAMLRPKSPRETREDYVKMGVDQILSPMEVQRQLTLRGDSVNDLMMAAIQKQTMETEAMITGQPMQPAMEDDHDTHLFACQLLINSPKWMAIPEEAREMIMEHTALHRQGQAAIGMLEMQLQQGAQQQGSPPAEAVGVGAGSPTEALPSAAM